MSSDVNEVRRTSITDDIDRVSDKTEVCTTDLNIERVSGFIESLVERMSGGVG